MHRKLPCDRGVSGPVDWSHGALPRPALQHRLYRQNPPADKDTALPAPVYSPRDVMRSQRRVGRSSWPDNGLADGFRSRLFRFQTCHLPQRKRYIFKHGTQVVKTSPRIREFLAFPCLTIFVLSGAETEWFRRPVNPLLFGRSEDLVTQKEITEELRWSTCHEANIARQCLPMLVGFGPIYPAPLYFAPNRIPIAMSPKTDVRVDQPVRAGDFNRQHPLAKVNQTGQSFFLWDYGRAAG